MAYIGKKPEDAFRGLAYYDTFTGDGSTTTFDLSADAPDGGQNDITVVVDNVRQEPGASKSYTLGDDGSGNYRRITFNVAPDNGSEIYAINPGRSTQLNTVSDNAISAAKIQTDAVTTAKIQDDAVTSAKIADGTIVSSNIAPGTIANDRLINSSITINGNAVSLGGSVTAGIDWQAVTVADGSTQVNAVAGKGYFLDTNAGVIEVFLPTSPTRGDTIVLADYASNFAINNVIVNTGGELIDSVQPNFGGGGYTLSTNDLVVELVYVDSNKGWLIKENEAKNSLTAQEDTNIRYITATGGTITTSGDFKIHSFTGDGCFVVSQLSDLPASNVVDYLVVAGGGSGPSTGGGDGISGGGGAGGFRFYANPSCNPQSGPGAPLNGPAGITVTTTTYPISVGAGGSAGTAPTGWTDGSNSVFSTITSTGGGRGGRGDPNGNGQPGGSGGGGDNGSSAGSGNTPPVSPSQGNNGGGSGCSSAGGGGGATAAGGSSSPVPADAGNGGNGAGITGFGAGNGQCSAGVQYFAGGGGGGNGNANAPRNAGTGGLGGGGDGIRPADGAGPSNPGTANTGGGGGGASDYNPGGAIGGNGGKGIVVIRYKFQ